MPTTEQEFVMTLQSILATTCREQLQWVKTFLGAGIPTESQGLLLRFTDDSEFKLVVLRTKRPKTYPVKQKGRVIKLTIPERGLTTMTPKFEPGKIVQTPGALDALERSGQDDTFF